MKSTQTSQKFIFVYLTILLFLALLFFPLFSKAQTTVPFAKRYETAGINGDLDIIGNSILGPTSNTPYNGTTQNNFINMVFVDIDGDPSTFNSSSANFSTSACNRVVYAGLYWGADTAPSTPAPNQVKFKIPGGTYQDLTADVNLDKIYYKDVTSIVTTITNPNGNYFVANISTSQGTSAAAGWSLVLVYEDATESRKFISTFDGFSAVRDSPNNQVDFNYTGFVTPPSGPVEGRVGVAALEGDLGWVGDQMLFRADGNAGFTALSDAENPANNFFNSKITKDGAQVTARNLNSSNTLGWDQKLLDLTALNPGNSLIGNNETGATVRVQNNVGGDWIYTFLNTFAINIIEPVVQVITSVEDTSGNVITNQSPVSLGATVWYDINFQNIGTDNAQNTYILNSLPINVTLDESS
ncbi:MAG: chromophore lyase, partial [Flavobacteriaceae bacterium]|nr:chromophore lyase [Flavobacteriaceae bacterium]